jgi:hypothetical protein
MSESYALDILYKGVQYEINCTLRVSAYTYQFLCTTGNSQIILEKDDEGNLRAVETDPFSANVQRPDPGLVRALMTEMERILQEKV